MDYDSCRSLPAMFFAKASRLGDKPFLWAKRDGQYCPLTWAQAAGMVRRLALGLRGLGIAPGERVGLVGENRPSTSFAAPISNAAMRTSAGTRGLSPRVSPGGATIPKSPERSTGTLALAWLSIESLRTSSPHFTAFDPFACSR